jgi:hypothetical protein
MVLARWLPPTTVVMDSAPVELVSDALSRGQSHWRRLCDQGDATPHQAVRQGLSALSDTGTTLLGAVLNQINPEAVHHYGKYKYGYSRYGHYGPYSYGHGPKAEKPRKPEIHRVA